MQWKAKVEHKVAAKAAEEQAQIEQRYNCLLSADCG
jgi:hypothetical protein